MKLKDRHDQSDNKTDKMKDIQGERDWQRQNNRHKMKENGS